MRKETKTGAQAQELSDKFKSIFSRKGYKFFEDNNQFNIISVRDEQAADASRFDDKLYFLYKENDTLTVEIYAVTTEPSPNWLRSPGNKNKPESTAWKYGAAILQPGQYESYWIGKHRNQYDAIVQAKGQVTVWRDFNKDKKPDYGNSSGGTQQGWYGINIHKHISTPDSYIDNIDSGGKLSRMSAGCTIFKYNSEFDSFMQIATRIRKNGFYKQQKHIFYTLINLEDFEAEEEDILPLSLYPVAKSSETHTVKSMATVYKNKPSEDGDVVKTLEQGSEIKLLQNYLGDNGNWVLAEKDNKRFYIKKELIEIKGENTEAQIKDTDKQINAEATPIDWVSQPIDTPYYDPSDGRWKVAVSLEQEEFTSLNEEQINEKVFKKGAELLLKHNNKKSDQSVIDALQQASTTDHPIQKIEMYQEEREGLGPKYLIVSPAKNMEALEDNPEDPKYVHYSEYKLDSTSVNDGFRNLLNKLIEKIRDIEISKANFNGTVSTFETEREIQYLENSRDAIEQLFIKNGFQDDSGDLNLDAAKGKLAIGWTADMKPVYLKYTSNDGTNEIMARKELEEFHKEDGISSKRTQNFILNLEEIAYDGIDYPWIDFLGKYANYEKVKITPNPEEVIEENRAPQEGPLVKTKEELVRENLIYDNIENKIAKREEREKESDYVGSEHLDPEKYPKLKKQLKKGTKDLYSAFLNNVDIQGLMLGAAKCLLVDQPIFGTARNIKNDYDVLKKEYDKYRKKHKGKTAKEAAKKEMEYFFPDDFPVDDISASYVKSLRQSMTMMVSAAIQGLLTTIVNSITTLCSRDSVDSAVLARESLPLPDFSDLKDRIQELFEKGNVSLDDLRNLFEDLALLLSPSELCSLLEGSPSDKVLQIVSSLLSRKYCHLGLKTNAQIIDFFVSLAREIDFQGCRNIIDMAVPKTFDDFLCPPDNTLRRDLLRGKGLTQQQIEDQLARERERSRRIVESFLKELKEGILSGTAQAPNMFCQKDKEGNLKEGPMPFMDDSLKLSTKTMIETLLGPTYSSFSSEGRGYSKNFFFDVPTEKELPNPLFPNFSNDEFRKVFIDVRTPLPEETKFYSSENKNIYLETTKFTIVLPEDSSNSNFESLLRQQGIEPSDFLESDKCSRGTDIQAQLGRISPEIVSKIEYEEYTACQMLENFPPEVRRQEQQEQEPETLNFDENAYYETDCENDTPISVNVFDFFATESDSTEERGSEELIRTPYERYIQERNSSADALDDGTTGEDMSSENCRNQPKYGVSIKAGSRKVFDTIELSEQFTSFLNENGLNENYNPFDIFETLVKSAFNEVELENEQFSVRSFLLYTGLFSSIRRYIIDSLFSYLEESPYLKAINRGSSQETNGTYVFDYVNLGPANGQECDPSADPHLLMVRQLADETMENIENNFCLDLEADKAADGPRKTNVDSSLIRATISLTIRHYIIDTLSSGPLSLSTLQGDDKLANIKKKYILERIKFHMNSYDDEYYNNFVEQAIDEYTGDKNDKTDEQILVDIIGTEYNKIKDGLFNAFLLRGKAINIKHKFGIKIPIYNASLRTLFDNQLPYEDSPFVIVRQPRRGWTLCLNLSTNKYYEKGNIEQKLTRSKTPTEPNYDIFFAPKYNADRSRGNYLIPISFLPDDDGSSDEEEYISNKKKALMETNWARILFELIFPLDAYETAISILEIETVSKHQFVLNAFGETRDELYTLLYAVLPQTDDWKKTPKALESFGGFTGITGIQDYNFGLKDTPCSDLSFNLGLDVCWGNPFKGLGLSWALRAARDTALIMLKDYIEKNDPNIKLAKKLAFLSKLACVNVDTSYFSSLLAILPATFPTPLTAAYNALGFGMYESSDKLNSDSDEGERSRRDIENSGLALPEYCSSVERLTLPEDDERHERHGRPTYQGENISEESYQILRDERDKRNLLMEKIKEREEKIEERRAHAHPWTNYNMECVREWVTDNVGAFSVIDFGPDTNSSLSITWLFPPNQRELDVPQQLIDNCMIASRSGDVVLSSRLIEALEEQINTLNLELTTLREEIEQRGLIPLPDIISEQNFDQLRITFESEISGNTNEELSALLAKIQLEISGYKSQMEQILGLRESYITKPRYNINSGLVEDANMYDIYPNNISYLNETATFAYNILKSEYEIRQFVQLPIVELLIS